MERTHPACGTLRSCLLQPAFWFCGVRRLDGAFGFFSLSFWERGWGEGAKLSGRLNLAQSRVVGAGIAAKNFSLAGFSRRKTVRRETTIKISIVADATRDVSPSSPVA